MISLQKHAFRLFLSVFLGLLLWGCGGAASISNGQNIAKVSGKADSQKTYTIMIPENTISLIVQAAGSDSITLDLLDADGVSLPACNTALFCTLASPAAGKYKLQLNASADFAGVNLSASWGGPDVSLLKNDIAVATLKGDSGTVLLQSLYVDAAQDDLLLQGSALYSSRAELLDQHGNSLQTCATHSCRLGPVNTGLYYVRLSGFSAFADGTLIARWGDSFTSTLENGLPKTGMSGTEGMQFTESFYLPEDSTSVLVQASDRLISLILTDANGNRIGRCTSDIEEMCFGSDLAAGLYYVQGELQADLADFSLLAVWGNANLSTLQNAEVQTGLNGNPGDSIINTLFVPQGAESAIVSTNTENVITDIYDSVGNRVTTCSTTNAPCVIQPFITPGFYFVRSRIETALNADGYNLFALIGGAGFATIQSGELRSTPLEHINDLHVENIYLDQNTTGAALAFSYGAGVQVFKASGQQVCYERYCVLEAGQPQAYFVVMQRTEELPDNFVTLSYAAVGPSGGTLQPAQTKSGSFDNDYSIKMESFYVPEGVGAFAFAFSSEHNRVSVLDATGDEIFECFDTEFCQITAPNPGNYYVIYGADPSYALALAFGGAEYATLAPDTILTASTDQPRHVSIDSFYLPDDGNDFGLLSSYRTELYSAQNHMECNPRCILEDQPGGIYFAKTVVLNEPGQAARWSLSLALGGPEAASLGNGQTKKGQLQFPGASKIESVYLPEDAYRFMVSGSGAYGEIEIFDAQGKSIASCQIFAECFAGGNDAATYYIAVTNYGGSPDGNQYDLSLAYGGPGLATIQSGVPFTLQKPIGGEPAVGDTFLNSVYVPANYSGFGLAGSSYGFNTEVFNAAGTRLCSTPCILTALSMGTYFVKTTIEEPSGNQPDLRLSMALGGADNATLGNGQTKTYPQGEYGAQRMESFFIPDDVESVMLRLSGDNNSLDILNEFGNRIKSCNLGNPCVVEAPTPGTYYAVVTENGFPEVFPTYTLSLAFGGANYQSIHSGETIRGSAANVGDIFLNSIYLNPGISDFGITSTFGINSSIYNVHGQRECTGSCILSNLTPGVYFIESTVAEEFPLFMPDWSLSLALGGPDSSTLTSGENKVSIAAQPQDSIINSFFLPPDASSFAFVGSTNTYSSIFNSNGLPVCANNCFMNNMSSGIYYVVTDVMPAAETTVSLSLAVSGTANGSWHSGETLSGLNGSPGNSLLYAITLPEFADAGDHADSLLLSVSPAQVDINILDQDGYLLQQCPAGDPCGLQFLTGGLYYAQIRMLDGAGANSFTLSAAWSGPGATTLANGVVYELAPPQDNSVMTQSFYLPEAGTVTLNFPQGLAYASFIGLDGRRMQNCNGNCTVPIDAAGGYFVEFYTGEAAQPFSFSLNW